MPLECYEELLSPYFVPVVDSVADLDLSEAQASFAATIAEQLLPTDNGESAPVIELRGRSGRAKLAIARQAARHAGLALFHVTSRAFPTQASDIDALARLLDRECALIPVVLFVSAGGTDAGSDILSAAMIQFMDRCRCPLLIDGDVSATESIRPRVVFEIASPTRLEQRSCWVQSLPSLAPQMLDRLADAFDLELSVIREVARRARVGTERNGELTEETLWAACLLVLRPQMDALAERVTVKAGFERIRHASAILRRGDELADEQDGAG